MTARYVDTVIGSGAPHYGIAGTDLGIAFDAGNGRVGLVLGDSFDSLPDQGVDWRSPCIVWSRFRDGAVEFTGCVGVANHAREVVGNQHRGTIPGTNLFEFTVIPNDVFRVGSRLYMSVMSVCVWQDGPLPIPGGWRTNLTMLYRSDDGGETWQQTRAVWLNNSDYSDVWQMQSWVVDGGYAYLLGTSNGRLRNDGLFLARVPVARIEDRAAYEYWGFQRANLAPDWVPDFIAGRREWRWGRTATPILSGMFGEPSVRIVEGVWVICAARTDWAGTICTWTAPAPNVPWSQPTVQVTQAMAPSSYGGFIHPASTLNELHLMVSQWIQVVGPYEVQHWKGVA